MDREGRECGMGGEGSVEWEGDGDATGAVIDSK